ncbi:uncharacterized protein L969DRAFT_602608 [Mixia osmundae IAM 14324]|uniref:uncharacterized protein n=1 Tax=Mixia osmundae (strain CBS 9802 / IAM 14324 / JCM 22182 / KY 12970) TaxID=764103 RepID=UPI0004A558CF|nr:uncharacterized protein L969DRAFT_602608 [Mixia osmundae IAM 14324]KEI37791.1 hypothetical protein L969DRAFT_602608 [Mixia osmundae IAM 14324]
MHEYFRVRVALRSSQLSADDFKGSSVTTICRTLDLYYPLAILAFRNWETSRAQDRRGRWAQSKHVINVAPPVPILERALEEWVPPRLSHQSEAVVQRQSGRRRRLGPVRRDDERSVCQARTSARGASTDRQAKAKAQQGRLPYLRTPREGKALQKKRKRPCLSRAPPSTSSCSRTV